MHLMGFNHFLAKELDESLRMMSYNLYCTSEERKEAIIWRSSTLYQV